MTMRHRLALTLAAVALLATLALGSCDHGSSPTAAHPELDPGVEAPEPASSSPFLLSAGKPVLPPGLRNLPVGQVMTMELVGFPHPDDVGVCFTQVASPAWMLRANPPPWLTGTGAPVPDRGRTPAHVFLNLWHQEEPFRLHRLEVDLPQQAWAEADGRVAFLQYRMKDQHGRVHRLARCVIPASQVAADHLLDRFSYGRADRAVATPFSTSAASCPAGQLGVSAGPGAGPSAPSLVEGGDCPSGRCPCPEDNTWNVPGPAGASPHGTDGSPNCDCVFVEEVGCFPVLEVDGLLIGPGCTGWGTYFNPFWEECRCIDSSLEPDENGDCTPDLAGPGSGGGTICDPFYENCDPGGGGGGTPGNGNNNGDSDPSQALLVECSPSTVTRGSPVSCLARPGDSTVTMENLVWTFASEAVSLDDLPSDNPLAGPLVMSGTLTAEATVNGVDGIMESVLLSVNPRDWSNEKWTFDVVDYSTEDPLPIRPESDAHLGDFQPEHFNSPNLNASQYPIGSGPNKGVYYTQAFPPAPVTGRVRINRQAIQSAEFLAIQTSCTAADLAGLIPKIEAHEGLNLEADSHSRVFRDTMWSLGGPAMEGIVGTEQMEFISLVVAAYDGVMVQAEGASALVDTYNQVQMTCTLVYFNP